MKLQNLDKEEAWEVKKPSTSGPLLTPGWHKVTIDSADEGETSKGNPQIELSMSNDDGSIRDWVVVLPQTYGKVKALLVAAGIEVESGDWDFQPSVLVGRPIQILVGDEPDYNDPTKMRTRVQGYVHFSDVPVDLAGVGAEKSGDDDIPF